jgi:hypothetical protein
LKPTLNELGKLAKDKHIENKSISISLKEDAKKFRLRDARFA